MKRNFELTKYPHIFKHTQWGYAKVGVYGGLYENRNLFVEKYKIKAHVLEIPLTKQLIIDDVFKRESECYYDHVEHFLTESNKYVSVVSPYIGNNNHKFESLLEFLKKNEFKLFEPMYCSSASSFIIELSDGFMTDKQKKIQGLHKFMDKLKQDPNMNPNIQDENLETPLLSAIDTNQTDIVQSLLNHPRIKVNLKDSFNFTPLYRAIDNYQTDIVLMLLEHPRIDPNLVNGPNQHYSRHVGPVGPSSPTTFLQLCYTKNSMDYFKLLLEHDRIDPNLEHSYLYLDHSSAYPLQNNLLHDAIINDKNVATELLLQHPRIELNVKDENGNSELHHCIRYDNTFAFNILVKNPRVDVNLENDDDNTVLYQALEFYRMDMLRILLKHPKLNVNKKQLYQKPLLHLFVEGDEDYDMKDEDCIELFDIMIENPSFDVNILHYDQTALDRACLTNSPEWVHRLLSHSSLEDVQRTYDTVVFNADDPTHTNIPEDENWTNNEIVSILNNFIEKEKKEDRYLTEKFCMSMIQPFVHTQLKRRNPLYIGPDLIKDISSYLQWSDISKKSKKEMKNYFEDFPKNEKI